MSAYPWPSLLRPPTETSGAVASWSAFEHRSAPGRRRFEYTQGASPAAQPVVEVPASTETDEAPRGPGATTENIGPYSKKEQRSQRGCIVGRMPAGLSPRAARPGSHRLMRAITRFVLSAAVLAVPAHALATWSVIALDATTGQVIIASATCVRQAGFPARTPNGARDLMDVQAVIVPGLGVAACQAGVDNTRKNQMLVYNEIRKGTAPAADHRAPEAGPRRAAAPVRHRDDAQGATRSPRATTAPASTAPATRRRRSTSAGRSATSTTRCRATRCSAIRWCTWPRWPSRAPPARWPTA